MIMLLEKWYKSRNSQHLEVQCFTTFVSNVWSDMEGEVCDEYGMVWMSRHVYERRLRVEAWRVVHKIVDA